MKNTLFNNVEAALRKQNIIRDNSNIALNKLPQPSSIPNMNKAANIVMGALEAKKKILILGDYDLDGITATSLMVLAFRDAGLIQGVHFDWIVPDRFEDGYGISRNMVDYALNNGFDVIITVDNGITAVDAISYAKENGLTVVITDHHTPGATIPNADVIVDLKYKKGKFPMVEISGCAIAWFFQAQLKKVALKRSKKRKEAFPFKEINMREYVDLVGLSVISDVMPLYGMNIGFYRQALADIKAGKRLVYELFFNENKRVFLTETNLSFDMIPAMNAVGRISHAKHAVEIFISEKTDIVQEKYHFLEDINRKRKRMSMEQTEQIMPEAIRQVKAGKKAIVIYADNLHEGIVGILAGKLAEKFGLPAYVFGFNKIKGLIKGSGRTVGSVHLYDLTFTATEFDSGFGGHAGAVGVGIKKENFKKWREAIWENASNINEEDFKPINVSTFDVVWNEIDRKLLDLIYSYRPFGEGFPEPVFKIKGKMVLLKELGTVGQHWNVSLEDENFDRDYIDMFFDPNIPSFDGTVQEINMTLSLNHWNNRVSIKKLGKIVYK